MKRDQEKAAGEMFLPRNSHVEDTSVADTSQDLVSEEKLIHQLNNTTGSDADTATVDKGPPMWRSQRYILAYVLFGGMMNIFFQRINLSIAIICMVNHTAIELHGKVVQGNNQSFHDTDSNNANFSSNSERILLSDSPTSQLRDHSFSSTKDNNDTLSIRDNKSPLHSSSLSLSTSLTDSRTFSSHETVDGSKNGADLLRRHSKKWKGTESQNLTDLSQILSDEICGHDPLKGKEKNEDGPLVWTKEEQGILLGAVYWTYLIVQIPGNHFVRNLKKKTVILVSMGIMTIMTMLIHVAALWSLWAVFVLKLVQGACTALAVIAIYGMWAKWAPPNERTALISFAISGQMFGNIIVFPVSSLLCKYGFLGGWPSVFYVFGIVSFIWVILCFFFTEESPATHRFITEKEKKYIISSLPPVTVLEQPKTPWGSILSSTAFWGIVCAHVSFTWGLFLFLSTLPQYMNEVLKFHIEANGVFSMLPYIALFSVTQCAGQLCDYLIRNKILRPIWVRKMYIIIANMVPAVLLAAMSFLDCTQAELAIGLLVLAVGATGFGLCGFLVNPYDIAPRFAIVIMSISNSIATIPGILAPYVVASITKDQTREQWQIVLFLTTAIYTVGTLGFCLLARGEVQPWALETRPDIHIHKHVEEGMVENEDL